MVLLRMGQNDISPFISTVEQEIKAHAYIDESQCSKHCLTSDLHCHSACSEMFAKEQ